MSSQYQAVVIGASAGAVEALGELLPNLPASFKLPVFVVVHIPPDRPSVLAEIFRNRCKLPVHETDDKEPIEPGSIFFAPPNYHMLVETPGSLALSNEDPVQYSRPAIDVLFESAADAYGEALIGIVLTGANDDGAAGLRAICAKRGTALVQDPAEASSATMPQAALKACPQARSMTLSQISSFLKEASV